MRPDVFGSDVFRLTIKSGSPDFAGNVQSALVAIANGKTASVPVYVTRTQARSKGNITITIVSESDPTKRATVTASVQ